MTQVKANETVEMLKGCGVDANVIRLDATAHSIDKCLVTARKDAPTETSI